MIAFSVEDMTRTIPRTDTEDKPLTCDETGKGRTNASKTLAESDANHAWCRISRAAEQSGRVMSLADDEGCLEPKHSHRPVDPRRDEKCDSHTQSANPGVAECRATFKVVVLQVVCRVDAVRGVYA